MSCTTNKLFNSKVKYLGKFAESIPDSEIKNEPMFFNSDYDFAFENGGEITKSFLLSLPHEWRTQPLVFDSRVHMLMPGWYPAIPGWHHDDVPRQKIPTGQHFITAGQPDYDNPRYQSDHIMGLVNASICPTEFAIGECGMNSVNEGDLVYRQWDSEIRNLLQRGEIYKVESPDRTLLNFNCNTFHTGQKAVGNGWRWFGRVSRNTDRVNEVTNEIRAQVQVYLEFPMEGW